MLLTRPRHLARSSGGLWRSGVDARRLRRRRVHGARDRHERCAEAMSSERKMVWVQLVVLEECPMKRRKSTTGDSKDSAVGTSATGEYADAQECRVRQAVVGV